MLIEGYRPVEGVEMFIHEPIVFDSLRANPAQNLGRCSRIKNCCNRCMNGIQEAYQNGSLRMALLTTYGLGMTLLFVVLAGRASDLSHRIGFGAGAAISGIGTALMGYKAARLCQRT